MCYSFFMADGQSLSSAPPPPRTDLRGVSARPLTVDDVLALSAARAFAEEEKVELIDGRLYVSPSEGYRHLDGSGRVGEVLYRLLATTGLIGEWRMVPNLSLRINDHRLLQPDWAVLRRGVLEAEKRLPAPADIALAVEIADTSLLFDEGDKKELYAEAGLAEYWVLRLGPGGVRVCRDPEGGLYRFDRVLLAGEIVRPLLAPEYAVEIDSLMPA